MLFYAVLINIIYKNAIYCTFKIKKQHKLENYSIFAV